MPIDLQDAEDEFHAALTGDPVEDASPDPPTDLPTDDAAPVDATEDAPPAEDGDDPSEPPPEPPTPSASAATPPAPTTEPPAPFTVTVHGQQHAIPGLTLDKAANAFRFADDRTFARVQNLLTKGREWETRGRQELHATRRELEATKAARTEREAQAEAYLSEWRKLMELPDEQFLAFAQAARQEWPRVQAQAERAVAEQKLAEAQRLQQPPEPDPESLLEQAQEGAEQFVRRMVAAEPWADPQTQQALVQWMQSPSVLGQFVYRAPQDVPQHGIRQGQWVADWDRARELLVQYANPLVVAYQARQTAAPVAQATGATASTGTPRAAQQNARVLATAGRARGPAPAPRVPNGSTPPASTRRDARKALDDDLDRIARDVLKAS